MCILLNLNIIFILLGSLLLAESYILTGQPGKAFDVCLKNAGSDVVHFLNAIRLFEKHSRSDLVIEMATKALELLIVSHSDRVWFVLFLQF